jgi:hypothetical protein
MGQETLVRALGGLVGAAVLLPMTALWGRWLWRRLRSPRR